MVRAPPARPHPPLHAEAVARRDRAGRGARFPAFLVRVAAGHRQDPHGGPGRARRGAWPARTLRGPGRRLGNRDPGRARRRLRAGMAPRPPGLAPRAASPRSRRRGGVFGMGAAGRWAGARRSRPAQGEPQGATPKGATQSEAAAVEHLAHTLLRRYGVVFWRVLEREAAWLPPWRDLLRVYRRLEARGEIPGGRFFARLFGPPFPPPPPHPTPPHPPPHPP